MTSRLVFFLGVMAAVAAGCGGGGSGGGGVSPAPCHEQCAAQQKVTGCTPFVDLATCDSMCDALAGQTPATCEPKFSAYYSCSTLAGFECLGSLVTQKGNACRAEQSALDKCQNGGKSTTCEGALDGGFCPSVECACPSGPTPISGFDQSSGSCKCFDATTCKSMCG
jgi:hypothetical protein